MEMASLFLQSIAQKKAIREMNRVYMQTLPSVHQELAVSCVISTMDVFIRMNYMNSEVPQVSILFKFNYLYYK